MRVLYDAMLTNDGKVIAIRDIKKGEKIKIDLNNKNQLYKL